MKPKIILITSAIVLLPLLNFAQTTKLYSYNNSVEIQNREGSVKNELSLYKIKQEFNAESAVLPLVLSVLAPKIIKRVSKAFYNPENYMKESDATESMLLTENMFSFRNMDKYDHISFTKSLGETPIQNLVFSLSDDNLLSKFMVMQLTTVDIKETEVKLKSNHHKINLVIDMSFHYFNNDLVKKEFKIAPLQVNNIVPGQKFILDNELTRLIPNLPNIESISIKVSEVNSRKKYWDEWLELYQNNSEKIQEYLLGFVKD